MAILTQILSTRWEVTFNRVELSTEPELVASHIIITGGNAVVSISGTGLQRVIILSNAVTTLTPSELSIAAHSGMEIVSTANANEDLLEYLDEIRTLIWTNLTEENVSNTIIRRQVYLGLAEIEVLDSLGLTSAQYNTKAASDEAFQRRARIAVAYRTAAYLLPAVPQLLREEIQQEYKQFAQVDWKERQTLFLSLSGETIEDDVPVVSTVLGKAGLSYNRVTYF